MMKTVFRTGFLLLCFANVSAEICDPMMVEGNESWVNPNDHSLLTTELPRAFRGGNCKDQIIVNSTSRIEGMPEYAYFLPEVTSERGKYSYDFSIDFTEILSVIGTGNRIEFFQLLGKKQNDLSGDASLIAKIRIKKKPLTAGGFSWKVHVIWFNLPDAEGNVTTNYEHSFWLSSDIDFGLLHFFINWSERSLIGSTTSISVASGLYQVDENDNSISLVKLDTSRYANIQATEKDLHNSLYFVSPFYFKKFIPVETRLGLISYDDGVNLGDGITFYTPMRFE